MGLKVHFRVRKKLPVYPVQEQENPFSAPHLWLRLPSCLFHTLLPLIVARVADTPQSCYMPSRFYLLHFIGPVMFVGEYLTCSFLLCSLV